MLPVIAIVGRPNVGKSTLFNCLTRSRAALVVDLPGVTRDRQYGEGSFEERRYIVIDTGGLEAEINTEILELMAKQSLQALAEADIILFVVDAKEGLTPNDYKVATKIRHSAKPVFLVVNKTEAYDPDVAKSDFFRLGFEHVFAIASAHNRGIAKLMAEVLATIPEPVSEIDPLAENPDAIKIAIIGRPNVGKSTLVNRILGEERVLVFDEPGTTRDSIFIPFQRHNKDYVLIDTAGVRRRGRIHDDVEKFSVIKSLQSIEVANVVVYVLNAREGISDQDMRLLAFIVDAGKALVVAVNKWDNMTIFDRDQVKSEYDRRLEFVAFARTHFISALHGTGVGGLFASILEAFTCATQKIPTPKITKILLSLVQQHQPPLVHGRRIKLRYAHAGGYNPPIIVIHGNQTDDVPNDYLRYLINYFRKRLKLVGTPIRIEFKNSENPYKDRRNILSPSQQAKKARLRRYVKKSKK